MGFKGFNYWSGISPDYETNLEPIFNENVASRTVLFEKTYVPKLIITSTPTGGFNFITNLWAPTNNIDTTKAYPIGTVEGLSWGDYPENTYWEKQVYLDNVATRIVIFEKYKPHTFNSIEVVGGTRAIRATWTPELAQDLEAYHSIDAEAELTALLSEEIAKEIDKQIVTDLITEITGRNVVTRKVLIEKTIRDNIVYFPKISRIFS